MSLSSADNSLHQQIKNRFETILPLESLTGISTLIAVSGGPDSVALAHWLTTEKIPDARLVLAHFNHGLRGEESDEDERFVRALADSLDCEMVVQAADNLSTASHRGEGPEALARTARYRFLKDIASNLGTRFVLTAHTLEDQVETVVQRIFRGTGIRGLSGIPPVRNFVPGISLVRPLLACSKKLLLNYLRENNLNYRVDSSNQSEQFTRNRLRKELIPLADEIFENDVQPPLLSLAEQSREFSEWVDANTEQLIGECVELGSAVAKIRMEGAISQLPDILLNELWIKIWSKMEWPRQQMNRDRWNSITQLSRCDSPAKINLPGNLLAEFRDGVLTIWDASANST